VTFAVAVLAAVPATAQTTGSLIPNRGTSSSVSSINVDRANLEGQPGARAMSTGRAMATCMVARQPKRVEVLLAQTSAAGMDLAWRPLLAAADGCLFNAIDSDADLIFSNNTVRSLLAEAMFMKAGPPRLALAQYSSVVEGSDWITDNAGAKVVLRTADCVVARKPAEVADLLATTPEAATEKSAFAALVPTLGTCLETGVTLKANRTGMRLALASALDRRARLTAGKE